MFEARIPEVNSLSDLASQIDAAYLAMNIMSIDYGWTKAFNVEVSVWGNTSWGNGLACRIWVADHAKHYDADQWQECLDQIELAETRKREAAEQAAMIAELHATF